MLADRAISEHCELGIGLFHGDATNSSTVILYQAVINDS